jgi:Tfp pilus assembly protein PilF
MVTKLSQDILEDYLYKLNQFDVARERKAATPEHVLAILTARDEIHREITREDRTSLSFDPQRLIELDDRLRKNAGKMTKVVREKQLGRWRSSMGAGESAWWWWLEDAIDHPLDRFDGFFKLLVVMGWAINISLMINLAARFFSGGIGLAGVVAVALPSILGLLQIGSEFTKSGQVGFNRFLRFLRIPRQWREEIKLGLTIVILIGLCFLWSKLDYFSTLENISGEMNLQQRKFGQAEQNFLKAVALNPNGSTAHNNLGLLYDSLGQLDKAEKEYLIAITGNSLSVTSNLARLYIKQKKYSEAAALLSQALEKIEDQDKRESYGLKKKNEQEIISPQVQYDVYKNFGWVRLEQGHYEDAQALLEIALDKAKVSSMPSLNESTATAHCMLAMVLEKQKLPSKKEWRKCLSFGVSSNSDQDFWLFQAQKRLKNN